MSQRVSPDGMYYWDGQAWVSTLSYDGRHRWNGEAWVPVGVTAAAAPRPRAVREPTQWTRPLQYALGAWFALAAVVGVTAPIWMGGVMTQIMNQSIQQQERLNPEASPLPAGFTDSMATFVTGIVWFAAIFALVLYGAGFIGVVMRWTWLYYAILGLFGLGLIGLPVNIVNAATGHLSTGAQTLDLPPWFLYSGLVLGLVQAALFVCMLVALVKIGPWAMRRVT